MADISGWFVCGAWEKSCAKTLRIKKKKIFFFFLGIHFVFYQTRTPFHFQFSLQSDASFTQPRNQQHNARVSFHSGTSDTLWAKPWHVFVLACYYFVNVLSLAPIMTDVFIIPSWGGRKWKQDVTNEISDMLPFSRKSSVCAVVDKCGRCPFFFTSLVLLVEGM